MQNGLQRPLKWFEVSFTIIDGTIEVFSKCPHNGGLIQPLYWPLKRLRMRSNNLPQRFYFGRKFCKIKSCQIETKNFRNLISKCFLYCLQILQKSKNFLFYKILPGKFLACKMKDFYAIFYYIQNVGVNYLTSVQPLQRPIERLDVAFIVRTFREDLNSSGYNCETDLKPFQRPLEAILHSYLKTPRIGSLG